MDNNNIEDKNKKKKSLNPLKSKNKKPNLIVYVKESKEHNNNKKENFSEKNSTDINISKKEKYNNIKRNLKISYSNKFKKLKSIENIPNYNNYIKFKDYHSNLLDELKNKSPKYIKQDLYHKKQLFNNERNNNNIINKFRSKSNIKDRISEGLQNRMNVNKNKAIKHINSFHLKNKRIPKLISIDLTKINKTKNKKIIKKISKKNIPLRRKNKKMAKKKDILSIKINLNETSENNDKENLKIINNNIKEEKTIDNNNKNKEEKNIDINIKQKDNENTNNNNIYKSYSFFEYPNEEYRESMEDCHDFKILAYNNFLCYYFSIFDGHNGKEVSLYLKENFYLVFLNELKLISFEDDYKLNYEKIISSIKKVFKNIDNNIINNEGIKDDVGSTGTIILLYRDPYDNSKVILITANIGDSKAFLINDKEIKKLTKDHNCDDKNEVERIKKGGGVVFQGRVFGSLILTRCFGDKEMKQYGILSEPYCSTSIINKNDLYIIIGSDGVWDVISDSDLFSICKENLPSEELVKKIVEISKDKGTTDNVTCLVIKLN